jgi:hypothetical protein
MATENTNLYQRLLAITEEIGKINKTGRNTMQGYAFIEQAQVVAEVRVQLAKHGVMIIPETVSRELERHDVTRTNGKAGVDVHARVASRYTLVNADDPQDRMTCEWDAGEAIDSGDKATNKATTASHKYFLMKLFNISDKDDPDADSPSAQKPAPAPKPVEPAPSAPEPPKTLTSAQIAELVDIAKKKGYTTKPAAVGFLNTQTTLPNFTLVPEDEYDGFKRMVISAGWKKPDAEVA